MSSLYKKLSLSPLCSIKNKKMKKKREEERRKIKKKDERNTQMERNKRESFMF